MTDEQFLALRFPPLAPDTPGLPALTLPDPEKADPSALFLAQPASALLDLPSTDQPDPPLPTLLEPLLPPNLLRFPSSEHSLRQAEIAPTLGEAPATLSPEIAAQVRRSADARLLPPTLHYDETRTTQDGMTHRLRHLASLLLALSQESPPWAGQEVPYDR
ncbi:hypothetical protein [Thermogemmatispora tikiterensis]|uniref:Uncharacterized protein n=1 Tax=Thermogemmatispora tikiterensis TaxID=1825093 RepID=A0A328VD15_9CHLR|nr:hypothetical protein [Thermogemmatispora tikiterensis]RAQ95638.1 hypothetical protein A4R35_08845 [Thermogemmatispora tikiterensis]